MESPGSLKVHIHISSETGLSSLTNIIIIDPPLFLQMQTRLSNRPGPSLPALSSPFLWRITALIITSARIPSSTPFPKASSMLRHMSVAGIDREYAEKVVYWPEPYNYSFFIWRVTRRVQCACSDLYKETVWITRFSGCRRRRRSSLATRFMLGALMPGKRKMKLEFL